MAGRITRRPRVTGGGQARPKGATVPSEPPLGFRAAALPPQSIRERDRDGRPVGGVGGSGGAPPDGQCPPSGASSQSASANRTRPAKTAQPSAGPPSRFTSGIRAEPAPQIRTPPDTARPRPNGG